MDDLRHEWSVLRGAWAALRGGSQGGGQPPCVAAGGGRDADWIVGQRGFIIVILILIVIVIARGSALECAACLDVLVAKKQIKQTDSGKEILARIVSMLVGLIRHTSSHRVYEQSADYGTRPAGSSD